MRARRIAGTIVAASLVLAACGGDDDDSADEPTAEPAAETTMAEEPAAETTMAEEPAGDMEVPEDWPDSIVFGFVPSQDQAELQDDIEPFITVLEEGLGIDVKGTVTTDYTGLVTAMGSGTADLGAFGPFGYVLGKDNFGNIEALIQSIRYGSATYHGQWFTNNPDDVCLEAPVEGTALENQDGEIVQVPATDAVALQVGINLDTFELDDTNDDGDPISPGYSCIGDLSNVAGKTIAWTTETSTSGYLFPALQLKEMGVDPTTDVDGVFTGGHDAAVTAVYNEDAEIGLSFDDARREITDTDPDVGEKVVVFDLTAEIPNDVVAVRSELPESLKQAIYDTIAAYLDTDEGQQVFDEIYSWTDIQPANEADFDVVRQAATELGITEPID
jgi:phosphonate transport system substrate-binding protein